MQTEDLLCSTNIVYFFKLTSL